ncbi:MAG: enoyl-CoA hydratase/isomerase family protein [Desulfobacteraceae bacterium]|nr:enoyl-CoA hydratase/isomerase family protein [Desulfobacteraceae bacterium]
MAYETILVEKKDKTMILTLNRPEKLNAMNAQMLEEISQVLAGLRGDADTRFVILTGAGKSFTSGADMGPRGVIPLDAAQTVSREQRLVQMTSHDLIRTYLNLEQVTIAAVNGYCLGAGLVFAIESDFIIAAEDALLGVPETNVGIFYTWGSSARLSRLVGPMWAKHIIMTCENVTGEQAVQIGLANQAVPNDKLMDAAWELIDKIASKSPLAIRLTKKLVNAYTASGQADLFVIEPELVERIHISGDPIEGGRAFREKRPPKFNDM